jgi:hypothetical protein
VSGKDYFGQGRQVLQLMKQISVIEDKVSGLVVRIMHLEECDSFLVGIIESVCEML